MKIYPTLEGFSNIIFRIEAENEADRIILSAFYSMPHSKKKLGIKLMDLSGSEGENSHMIIGFMDNET